MAVNPAEDIVNVWLQDNLGYFTRQNIEVRKKKGGKGKEIDILGLNTEGKRVWVEVSVSPNPRVGKAKTRVHDAVKNFKIKFCKEKEKAVDKIFGSKQYDRWFVYSHKLFSKKHNHEEKFISRMKRYRIKCFSFKNVLNETVNEMDHYSVDPTRVYIYYLKKFEIE